jgi:prepilin-type N-terminal cleavage/methylation domain-containing protein
MRVRQHRFTTFGPCAVRANGTPGTPTRAGFTLVELLVALVLLDVGLFALVATSALVTREMSAAARRAQALAVAANRLERVASMSCAATESAGGEAMPYPGVRERWTVTGEEEEGEARAITDSVAFTTAVGVRVLVLHSRTPC